MHKKAAPAWHRCGTFFEKAGSPIILHCFHKIPLCGSQIEYIDDMVPLSWNRKVRCETYVEEPES